MILALALAATSQQVVLDGSGSAVLASGGSSSPAVVRARLVDPTGSQRVAVASASMVKIRGAVRLTVESGLADNATLMLASSAAADVHGAPPNLNLHLNDASAANVSGIRLHRLKLVLEDGSSVTLKGSVDNLEVVGSGSASLEGNQIEAAHASVDLSGSGSVNLGQVGELTANLSSTGGVRVKGWHSLKETHTGVGRVVKVPG